jgi:Tol biopolymer transport system component
MTALSTKLKSILGRFLRSWQAPTVVGFVVLAGMIYWLAPRPVERIVPVDNSSSWKTADAPPQREIVWQTAREIPALFDDVDKQAELVTPKLNTRGTLLFFSRRIDGRQSDIYMSQLENGTWQPAQPMVELNTAANEVGPILSPDGKQLYFYSDRPGGRGGTDIYVASQAADGGWDKPRNLGPKVNSIAHEYDPAISPDGLSLYFASNRSDKTAQRIADDQQPADQEWNVTLRAQLDLTLFDLYRSRRDGIDVEWGPSTALTEISRPDSTDGAPFVSPNGAFLYFASDRTARDGERRNLDLYRTRLTGDSFLEPENLGPSINTPYHETEPGLSAEGFTIVFSSNRDGTDRLYASTATEIYRETEWDASELETLGVVWWWWLPLTLATLAAFILAALYFRNWLFERVWPARFFLGGVTVNLLVLLLLAVWTLPEVVDAIIAKVRDIVPAPDFVDESQHQSHEDGRESHEKVADLKSVETVPIPDVARKESTPISVPERNERLVPTIPIEQARALPQNRVIFVPPKRVQPVEIRKQPQKVELTRKRPQRPVLERDLPNRPPELDPVQAPQENAVAKADIEVVRSQNERPMPNDAPRPLDPSPLQRMRPAVAAVAKIKPAENAPIPPNRVPQPAIKRESPTRPLETIAETEAPTLEGSGESTPAEPVITNTIPRVDRTKSALINPASFSKPREPLPPASVVLRKSKVQAAAVKLPDGGAGSETVPTKLDRNRPVVEVAGVTVTSESPSPPVETTDVPKELAVSKANVKLDRSTPVSPKAGLGEVADRPRTAETTATAARPLALAAANVSPPLPDARPIDEADLNLKLRKRRENKVPAKLTKDDSGENQLALAASESESKLKVEASAVTIAKAEDTILGSQPAPVTSEKQPAEPASAIRTQLALARTDTASQPMIPDKVSAPLKRAARNTPSSVSSMETESGQPLELAEANFPSEVATEGVEVALIRTTDLPTAAAISAPRELTGPVSRLKHRVVVGELSDETNDAPPAFSPLANRLDRRRARATRVAMAEDNVGLKSLFTLRQGDTRRKFIDLLGGTKNSEKAVNLGLEWLAKHQEEDGSWDLKKHGGGESSRTAGTGLGLLPFLAAGHTHNKPGQYQKNVAAAVRWLTEHQKENGDLLGPGDGQHLYSHGIAAIALCEAYGMSRDEELKAPARKSLDFIVSAQHKASGGWRYTPNTSADTSVVGWQMMALKSGEMAGLSVAAPVYANIDRWLKKVEGKQGVSGTFGYVNRSASPAMTAEGLLSLQFLGTDRNSPRMRSGADYLLKNLPERSQKRTSYYWYYGTQVMYHMQGKYWKAWNESLRDMLVETQITTGKHTGTWHPRDQWESRGGRVYATSLKLLMLEVYYRHLPLYEQLEE